MNKQIKFPEKGKDKATIQNELVQFKQKDLNWKEGKAFAYIFGTDSDSMEFAKDAYALYLTENGLDPSAFPSLLQMEKEVMGMVADLLGSRGKVVGSLTSGGTESVILAVKTARDYYKTIKPEITIPEIIIPETAHPCFHKAGHYLGVKVVMIPVNKESFQADLDAMKAAINSNTIMLVGSAPSYAHGVIDPIAEIAALAKANKLLCHVDACVGGMYLPFAKMLGVAIPAFDFSVDGVTSMSCDLHKFGYVPKGTSTVLYRDAELRSHQYFTCSVWPGYTIVNPTIQSSKTGGPTAAAWAMFQLWGKEGYLNAVKDCQQAAQKVIDALSSIPELELLGKPLCSLLAFKSTDPDLSVFDIADAMQEMGWHLQIQLASNACEEAIHLTISHHNCPQVEAMMNDLKTCIINIKTGPKAVSALPFDVDPQMISMLMEDFTPDMLDMVEGLLGMDSSSVVPDKMATINSLLNTMTTEQRDTLLAAFVNRMFTSR